MTTESHTAIVTVAPRAPLQAIQVPTVSPEGDEVRVRVEWTASSPLDLHRADAGLLIQHPHILGETVAGPVIQTGPSVKHLKPGDQVFGFTWREAKENAHQEFIVAPEWLLGVIPSGVSLQEAVTVPDNLVTAFNVLVTDLKLPMPWPKPEGYIPPGGEAIILVWGAASSVGQYVLQVLKYFGYKNLVAVASPTHHDYLKSLGATQIFNYKDADVVKNILETYPFVDFIVDCIGSSKGSLAPISKIAKAGSRVAVMLPVIVERASELSAPEYSMDVTGAATWAEGVETSGVRTHFYLENELFKQKLQSEIMPQLLAEGAIKPNRYRILEGASLLERAQKAIDTLRSGVSGERLVWRVSKA